MINKVNSHLGDNGQIALKIYSMARIAALFVLCVLVLYGKKFANLPYLGLFQLTSFIYLFFAITNFSFAYFRKQGDTGAILSGFMDIFFINLLIFSSGNIKLGVLMSVAIAAHSVIAPGSISVVFAALASILLLLITWIQVVYLGYENDYLFYAGVLGAGFFATAMTALFLALKVSQSRQQAIASLDELASLQKINEYIIGRLYSGIVFIDEFNNIKLLNSAAMQLLAKETNDSIQNIEQLSIKIADKLAQWKKQMNFFMTPQRANVHEPDLLVQFIPVRKACNTAVLIVLEDMGKYFQEAQQLKLASLGRFTASLAHEIRNPLGAISHATQLLWDNNNFSEIDLKLLKIIDNNCNRMNAVVKNILQLSRRKKVVAESLFIKDLLIEFEEEFNEINPQKITLKTSVQSDASTAVFDKSHLYQILHILAENSLRHTKLIKPIIYIEVIKNNHSSVMLFKDNGVGINEGEFASIFEPFYTNSRKGIGMGLFIAKELCEINHASIVAVPASSGACFRISFNAEDKSLL